MFFSRQQVVRNLRIHAVFFFVVLFCQLVSNFEKKRDREPEKVEQCVLSPEGFRIFSSYGVLPHLGVWRASAPTSKRFSIRIVDFLHLWDETTTYSTMYPAVTSPMLMAGAEILINYFLWKKIEKCCIWSNALCNAKLFGFEDFCKKKNDKRINNMGNFLRTFSIFQ